MLGPEPGKSQAISKRTIGSNGTVLTVRSSIAMLIVALCLVSIGFG